MLRTFCALIFFHMKDKLVLSRRVVKRAAAVVSMVSGEGAMMRCALWRWSLRLGVSIGVMSLFAGGCASTPEAQDALTQEPARVEPASSSKLLETTPRFVVIDREQPLYLEPAEGAEFIQFMSDEERAQLEERERAEALARAKKEAEAKAKAKAAAKAKAQAKKPKRKKKKRRVRLTKAQREAQAKAKKEREERALRKEAERYITRAEREAQRQPYANPQGRYHVMRVVRELPDQWLELESLDRQEQRQHCWRSSIPELSGARYRFYVRQAQLSEVVVRLERFEFDSGVQIKLQPGAVVRRLGELEEVYVDGVQVRLDIPDDAIAREYHEPQTFEAPETDTGISDVAFMRDELKIDKAQRLPYLPFLDQFVVGTGWAKKRFYLTTQTPCSEFRVLTVPEAAEPLSRRRVTRIRGDAQELQGSYAPVGAVIWSQQGKRMGVVSQRLALGEPLARPAAPPRRCFKQRLWRALSVASWRSMTLCFDADDVREAP